MTPAWIETAFSGDHVLIAGAQGTQHDSHIKVITLDKKQQLSQLVSTYEFDRIVYFSEYLIPHSEQEGELECLRRVLQDNRECPVQLLYLAGPEEVAQPASWHSLPGDVIHQAQQKSWMENQLSLFDLL